MSMIAKGLAFLSLAVAVFLSGDARSQTSKARYETAIQGSLILAPDGTVTSVESTTAAPDSFHAAARNAIKSWRFDPPSSGGKPTNARTYFSATLASVPVGDGTTRIEVVREQFSDQPYSPSVPNERLVGNEACSAGAENLKAGRYPAWAARREIGAEIILEVRTNAEGRPVSVRAVGGHVISPLREMSQETVDSSFLRIAREAEAAANEWRQVACSATVQIPVTYTPPSLSEPRDWLPVHSLSRRLLDELSGSRASAMTAMAPSESSRGTNKPIATEELSEGTKVVASAQAIESDTSAPATEVEVVVAPRQDEPPSNSVDLALEEEISPSPTCARPADRFVDGTRVVSLSCNGLTVSFAKEDRDSSGTTVIASFSNESGEMIDVGPHLISFRDSGWEAVSFEDHIASIREKASAGKFWTSLGGVIGVAAESYAGGDRVTSTESGRFRARTGSGSVSGRYTSTTTTVDSAAARGRINDITEGVEAEIETHESRASAEIAAAQAGYFRRHTLEPDQEITRFFVAQPRSRRATPPLRFAIRLGDESFSISL